MMSKNIKSPLINPRASLIFVKFITSLVLTYLTFFLAGCGTIATVDEAGSRVPTSNRNAQLNAYDLDKYHQAKGHMVSGQFEQASHLLKPLQSSQPKHPGILINLGICHYQSGDITLADRFVSDALRIKPSAAQAHNLKGLINVKKNAYVEAEKNYLQAINIDSSLYDAHYNLALLYDVYFQDINKAYKHYEIYLSLTPNEDEETKNWLEQLKYSLSDV